jgi:anaerobic magnesium-protoporphyrin IX monomethyl ester cyclase
MVEKNMKHILMINVPSRKGIGGKFLPIGLLYLGTIIEKHGHTCSIYDPYLEDVQLTKLDEGDYSSLEQEISRKKPDIVAFGGIASSYGRTKKLSQYLYENYPEIVQVAGGPLASIYRLILTKTHIQIIFHGEAEQSFPEFLAGDAIVGINGISYLSVGIPHRNMPAIQVQELDRLSYPAYHLVPVREYIIDGLFPVLSSRGCTNKCSFCYRHMQGYRQHTVDYFINHLKFLIARYGITGFLIADEYFNYDINWVLDFCNKIEPLQIKYGIAGARINNITGNMLSRLKQTGCEFIYYGQESGSPSILKEYRKGITLQENIIGTLFTRNSGLKNIVQLVIGSPSETQDTINETIQFVKYCKADEISVNYLLPFPETPIWKYVEENNLILDIEKYLDEIAERGGSQIVNLTQIPDNIWRTWSYQIRGEFKRSNLAKIIAWGYRIAPEWLIKLCKE